jgi:Zn-dependent peptidase ImmA (M78 family)
MPKSVCVLGEKIPVKVVTQEKMDQLFSHKGAMGLWAPDLKTIFLTKESNKEENLYTLCHEIGHVLFTKVGFDQILASELQELIVQSYATLILDILKKRTVL